MNRTQRRALEKAERQGKVVMNEELSELGKQWIGYGKQNGIDFNAYFIMQAAWLRLTKNEKINVITELVSQGLVTPDEDSKKSMEYGKIEEEKDAEGESSEGEESAAPAVPVSGGSTEE